jgi:hypothetical protein
MAAVEVRIVPPAQHDAAGERVPEEGWYDPDSVGFATVWERSDDARIRRPGVQRRRDEDVVLPDER